MTSSGTVSGLDLGFCRAPNCGGPVVNNKCQRCKALYDGNPGEEAFLAAQGRQVNDVRPHLSDLSGRDRIPDEPTTLAAVNSNPDGVKRLADSVSLLALERELGAGLVTMPKVDHVDRLAQINLELRVPRHKRVCSNPKCQDLRAPIEEKTGKRPRPKLYHLKPAALRQLPPHCRLEEDKDESGATVTYLVPDRGHCRFCGTAFNFLPVPAETMMDQIRVDGQFGCGGDGIVYHATDTQLKMPVVLKGRHDALSVRGGMRASREVQALMAVQGHEDVVRVLGFKEYQGQSFIVLKWADGPTLLDVRINNKGPLPIEVGLSYVIHVMDVILHGHEQSPPVYYLDVKPENVVVNAPGKRLTVLDYGGSHIEGTVQEDYVWTEGLTAPELDPDQGKPRPSAAGDVFGLARLFCFLSLPFLLTGRFKFTIPTPSEEPIFGEFESAYRFVRLLTALNPDDRISLAEAITAAKALRVEVIALKEKRSVSFVCPYFAPDGGKHTELTYATLPQLRIDLRDEAAAEVDKACAAPDINQQRHLLERALIDHPDSKEAKLHLAALAIDMGDLEFAGDALEQLRRQDPFDWRPVYHLGRLALAQGDLEEARLCFEACYSARPAAAGIKLAIGLCAELMGNNLRASRMFETAARTNPLYVAGPFGWARCAAREGDWALVIEAYNLVPRTSWAFKTATIAKVEALIKLFANAQGGVGKSELQQAAEAADLVISEGLCFEAGRVKADVLLAAAAALKAGLKKDKSFLVLGIPLISRRLRREAAKALLEAKSFVPDKERRYALVDQAHRLSFRIF